MRLFFLWIIAIILFSFYSASAAKIDTIDYWHVFYNNRIIAKLNQTDNTITSSSQIKIKKSKITSGDILTIQYGDDTPCDDCKTALYILDRNRKKIFIGNAKGTWKPINVAIKEILKQAEINNYTQINIYYFDSRHDHLVFRVSVE